jgi:hypothetical protein
MLYHMRRNERRPFEYSCKPAEEFHQRVHRRKAPERRFQFLWLWVKKNLRYALRNMEPPRQAETNSFSGDRIDVDPDEPEKQGQLYKSIYAGCALRLG